MLYCLTNNIRLMKEQLLKDVFFTFPQIIYKISCGSRRKTGPRRQFN